jgi:hypothetical protein
MTSLMRAHDVTHNNQSIYYLIYEIYRHFICQKGQIMFIHQNNHAESENTHENDDLVSFRQNLT